MSLYEEMKVLFGFSAFIAAVLNILCIIVNIYHALGYIPSVPGTIAGRAIMSFVAVIIFNIICLIYIMPKRQATEIKKEA